MANEAFWCVKSAAIAAQLRDRGREDLQSPYSALLEKILSEGNSQAATERAVVVAVLSSSMHSAEVVMKPLTGTTIRESD